MSLQLLVVVTLVATGDDVVGLAVLGGRGVRLVVVRASVVALQSTGLTVPLGQQYPGGQGVGVVMLGLGQQKFGMHGVGVLEHGGQKVPG